MLEVEVKYALPDPAALEAALTERGAAFDPPRRDADHYFNAPDRDFASTDEAFRVRTIGESNFVTYKGPKIDRDTKSRLEHEIALRDGFEAGEEFRRLLVHLGYKPTAVVRKSRRIAQLQRDGFDVHVSLDNVDEVGYYAEVEVVAPEDRFDAAKTAVLALAAELGLTQVERRSYLHMLLESRAKSPPVATGGIAVAHTLANARQHVAGARSRNLTVALVPTMGALHEGHASLVRRARAECGYVVVWVFVNPTQFGPNEDFTRYPRTLPEDAVLCASAGADLVFAPAAADVYPAGFRTAVHVRELGDHLCGPSRPGHFDGVATVVLKMLTMIGPDRAYFGRKDAQQLRIIRQLVRDLDLPVEIVPCDTVREPDGLAMSSRNRYLDATQRANAPALYRALCEVRDRVAGGERDADALRQLLAERIATIPGATTDYAEVVDADSFHPVARLDGPAVAALAVKFGATRLIDNIDLVPGDS